jgi:FMN-dependent oxidoreductase (nitrilotriacetate monooxygenase family)
MFHLSWFVADGYSAPGWMQPWTGDTGAANWADPARFLDLARSLERGGFDYLIIEDSSFIPDAFRGSTEFYLRNAMTVPKCDPLPLVPLLASVTSRLGLVATITTTFYPPFLAARLGATLDHITRGRVGLNLVTAHNDRAAQNYGLERHYEHDQRYEIAEEWMQVVDGLWRSWEPDALVADQESGVFADYTKVHPIDFEGQYFRCRGPLNTAPGPQRRPVICQAGGSPAGIAFASKNADTIIMMVRTVEAAKAFRTRIRDLMQSCGRRPDECKVMFATSLVLGDTDEDAADRRARNAKALEGLIDHKLAAMSFLGGMDCSKLDLDAPLSELATNASRSALASYLSMGKETLREALQTPGGGGLEFVGSAATIAGQMEEAMAEIGGDGFLIHDLATRKAVSEVVDGLVPTLRRRGLVRSHYEHEHFRDNLLAF